MFGGALSHWSIYPRCLDLLQEQWCPDDQSKYLGG